MAKRRGDRKRKRKRFNEEASNAPCKTTIKNSVQHNPNYDASLPVIIEEIRLNSERVLQTKGGKESLVESSLDHSNMASPDEYGCPVVDTLLSLQHSNESERCSAKNRSRLSSNLAERHAAHVLSASKEIEKLRNHIKSIGGTPEDGWHADVQRGPKAGKLNRTFIPPRNGRYRSRTEVMSLNPTRVGTVRLRLKNSMQIEAKERSIPDDTPYYKQLLEDKQQLECAENLYHAVGGSRAVYDPCQKDHPRAATKFHATDANSHSMKRSGDAAVYSEAAKIKAEAPSSALVSQRCEETLRSIICTDDFAALSNMINRCSTSGASLQLQTFPLVAGSLDLQLIRVRLSNGAYGQAPELFYGDIQRVWANIISTGNELVNLANSLLELSGNLYKQQIMTLFQSPPHDKAPQISLSVPEQQLRKEQVQLSNLDCNKRLQHYGLSFENSQISQEHHLLQPTHSRADAKHKEGHFGGEMMPTITHPKATNLLENDKSLTHSRSQELKVFLKKRDGRSRASKAKSTISVEASLNLCKKCRLGMGADWIFCHDCNARYHAHCINSTPSYFRESQWSCPQCVRVDIAEHPSQMYLDKRISVNETREEPCVLDSDIANEQRKQAQLAGKAFVCKECKREDPDVLLCDGCETAYHPGCLNSASQYKTDKSWYCPACSKMPQELSVLHGKSSENIAHSVSDHTNGYSFFHSRNSQSKMPLSTVKDSPVGSIMMLPEENNNNSPEHGTEQTSIEQLMEYGIPRSDMERGSPEPSVETGFPDQTFLIENDTACKVCGVENRKPCVSCSGCSRRYHLTCLKPSLKRLPRKTWFCPSCLCRTCKIDADDDKILLCDGCDEGYHTYCLNPPLPGIPEGTWFCAACAKSKEIALNSPSKFEVMKRKRKSTEPRRCI